jgi:imidazolonepropionase-like amidohydrolase
MRTPLRLLAACALSLALPSLVTSADGADTHRKRGDLCVRGVTVIDPVAGRPRPGLSVLVRAGRIADVGPADRVRVPGGVPVVDGTGKFLIPGLWDMHVHIQYGFPGITKDELFPRLMALYLANGVTGVRDMGGPHLAWVVQRRREVEEGLRPGPRLVVASRVLDGPLPSDWSKLPARTAAEARAAVRADRAAGVDCVKVYDRLPRDAYFAAANECRRLGLPLVGHTPWEVSPAEAADAGQKSIEHLTRLQEACFVLAEDRPTPPADPDPATTRRLAALLADVRAGRADKAPLGPATRTALAGHEWQRTRPAWALARGDLASLTFLGRHRDGARTVSTYRGGYTRDTTYDRFTLASDGTVDWEPLDADQYSPGRAEPLLRRLRQRGTWVCPTLTALRAGAYRDDPALFRDPLLRYAPAQVRQRLNPERSIGLKGLLPADWRRLKSRYERDVFLVGKLRAAGVGILAGTDGVDDFCIPGFALHQELELLVGAGLTPAEALRSATSDAARFLGRQDELGSVAPGKRADLVVLDADPLADIRSTRRIAAVVFDGEYLPRDRLRALLAEVEAAFGR